MFPYSEYHISSVIRQTFFSFQNNPKDLDPSCKTDLDLWDCLGRVKLGIIEKFHRTNLVIWSHSRGTKPPSYSRINTVYTAFSQSYTLVRLLPPIPIPLRNRYTPLHNLTENQSPLICFNQIYKKNPPKIQGGGGGGVCSETEGRKFLFFFGGGGGGGGEHINFIKIWISSLRHTVNGGH